MRSPSSTNINTPIVEDGNNKQIYSRFERQLPRKLNQVIIIFPVCILFHTCLSVFTHILTRKLRVILRSQLEHAG